MDDADFGKHMASAVRSLFPGPINGTNITTLYPLLGLATCIVSYGYLHFGWAELFASADDVREEKAKEAERVQKENKPEDLKPYRYG